MLKLKQLNMANIGSKPFCGCTICIVTLDAVGNGAKAIALDYDQYQIIVAKAGSCGLTTSCQYCLT